MTPTFPRSKAVVTLLLFGPALFAQAGEHPPTASPETGGAAWEVTSGGLAVRVGQISPDQARAFYLARGFDRASVERIAATCVFQTVLRNVSTSPISYNVAEWRAITGDKRAAPILETEWQREWQARGVAEAARTAFRWALFPTDQQYQPGDWNMGMVMYPFAPGTQLDLEVVWRTDSRKSTTIKGVRCAGDEKQSQ